MNSEEKYRNMLCLIVTYFVKSLNFTHVLATVSIGVDNVNVSIKSIPFLRLGT